MIDNGWINIALLLNCHVVVLDVTDVWLGLCMAFTFTFIVAMTTRAFTNKALSAHILYRIMLVYGTAEGSKLTNTRS